MKNQSKHSLQKAKTEDLHSICRLLDSCNLPFEDLNDCHLEHFFLIKNKSSMLGCVGVEVYGDVALLRSLAVSANERDQGLGNQLVQQIETYAKEQGISSIYLLTTTAEDFFHVHGYIKIKREAVPDPIRESKEFTNLCPASAIVMQKNLAVE